MAGALGRALQSREKGEGRRGQCVAGALGRASVGEREPRMHTKVGNREEGGEGSAWLARLGAPLWENRRAIIGKGEPRNTRNTRKRKNRTTNGHEWTRK